MHARSTQLAVDAFVAELFEGLPDKPPGFAEMIATNRSS
jgi:hypothetical protein